MPAGLDDGNSSGRESRRDGRTRVTGGNRKNHLQWEGEGGICVSLDVCVRERVCVCVCACL